MPRSHPGVAITVVPVAGPAGAPGASPTVPATSTQGRRQLTSEAPVCHRNRAGSRRAGESVLAAGRRLSPTLPVLLFKVSIGGTATGSGTLSGTQVAVLVTRTVASEYRSPKEPSKNLRSLNFKSKFC